MIVPSQRLLWLTAAILLPLAGAAGMVSGIALPCTLAGLAFALIALMDALSARERLDAIELRIPQSVRLTKAVPSALPVSISNRAGKPLALRIAVILPAALTSDETAREVTAPAGDSSLEWPCTGMARGDYQLRELFLEFGSALGLWHARGRTRADCTFRIFPNLRDRATAALFQRTPDVGMRLRRQVGKGREFDNLRHYMPGDSYEDIHWKATARRGFPAVKLYRMEHAQEVYAVIDSSRLSMREGFLESYVEAALHLALVAERHGDRFGLATFSDRTHRFVRARSGLGHFRLCRETIYNLRATRVNPSYRDIFSSLQTALRRRSLIVFFTSLDDALLAETFEREVGILARRHLVLVNMTKTAGLKPLYEEEPPRDLDGLYSGLAGQILWNRMRKLQIALQNRGVHLAMVDAARIKLQVAAQYLDVKRRQAL